MRHFSRYFLFSLLAFFCLSILGVIFFAAYYYWQFLRSSGTSQAEIKENVLAAQLANQKQFNFLVLGLDRREASNGLLTDTIMVGFWRPKESRATVISLPRDLWLDHLKTKINALYYYGQEQDSGDKVSLLVLELERILGEPIDYYLIVDFEAMAQIVDLLSGVDVEVERAFDDYYFPTDDGAGGLTHLRFEAGWQTMDGRRILEYVRSRKSEDPEEGTDEARVKRQQKALLAIFNKLSDRRFWLTNPRSLGALYRYWQEDLETNIPTPLLINAGAAYIRQGVAFEFLSLPEEFLFNPPLSKYGLWVWEQKDRSGREIREWVKEKISN
jgi:polyisoprenyl-teichoic acid--peptidoglycan teichoic acid transferase